MLGIARLPGFLLKMVKKQSQQSRDVREHQTCSNLVVAMGVEPKIGEKPKMDGENNGTPYFLMDDLGGFTPYFWKHPYVPRNLRFHELS